MRITGIHNWFLNFVFSWRQLAIGVLLGLFCAGIVSLAALPGWTSRLEQDTLDRLFRLRGARYPSPDVVLVVADDTSVAQAGGWPLHRGIYADIIGHLQKAEAKTIAFDIIFSKESPSKADDIQFQQASQEAGRIVHAAILRLPQDGRVSQEVLPGDTIPPAPRFAISGEPSHIPKAVGGIGPRAALQAGAAAIGHINVEPDNDGISRRIPHLIQYQQAVYPSLALAAAAHFLDVAPQEIIAREQGITLPARSTPAYTMPLGKDGTSLINWVGYTRSYPTFSFNQILSGAVPDAALKGKVVLIGVTASAAFDHRSTPFSPSQPAMEIQANALDDILSRRHLQTVPSWLWFLMLCGSAVSASVVMTDRNAWVSSAWAAVIITVLWGMALALLHDNWYFPVASPTLAVLLTLAVCVSYRQTRDARGWRFAEERYAAAVRGANDGLWDWNLRTDHIYYSPRWKEIIGYSNSEIGHSPQDWFRHVHPDDLSQLQTDIQHHKDGLISYLENEHRLQHRDGTYRWALCRGLIVRNGRQGARMAGSLTDITERKQAEEQMRYDALHDALTGLTNRTLLINYLQHAMEQKKGHSEYSFSILFCDLDRFKYVNDSLGHLAGDHLIIELACRLSTCLRTGDTLARLGGDEFVILCNVNGDESEAIHVAECVKEALEKPFLLNDQEIFTTISIGIAYGAGHYEMPEEILRDAEIAMYRAKGSDGSSFEIFDTQMHQQVVSRLRLESNLRRALEREEFLLHYQPIVSLESGRITGFEALVRWQQPDGQLVPPGQFIPLSEETGVITDMDQWSLREACRQTQQWQALQPDLGQNPLTISVNLSSKLFSLPDLVPRIQDILQNSGIDPRYVKLEITESALVGNTETAARMLNELKALGVQLSIDDFGTGYSSLSYLHSFPLDTLKIDRSFVNGADTDNEKSKIVQTIIAMARNLDLNVIAEGIETQAQLDLLRGLNCDFGQGYLFSKPLPADEAQALLLSQNNTEAADETDLVAVV